MALEVRITKPKKDFNEALNKAKDQIVPFTKDAIQNGFEQAAINKVASICTLAAQDAVATAFVLGDAALITVPGGPLAEALLAGEQIAIVKATGIASEKACQAVGTFYVKGAEDAFAKIDAALSTISSNIVTPNSQAIIDYQNMVTAAGNGNVAETVAAAQDLTNQFHFNDFTQTAGGNYIFHPRPGYYELLDQNLQPVQLFQNNSDGTSDLIKYGQHGGYEDTHYSGTGTLGRILSIDTERGNNTSTIATFDANGQKTETSYSGPHGTGDVNTPTPIGPTGGQDTGWVDLHYQGIPFSSYTDLNSNAPPIYTSAIVEDILIHNLPSDFVGDFSFATDSGVTDDGVNPFVYSVKSSYGNSNSVYANGFLSFDGQLTSATVSASTVPPDYRGGEASGWTTSFAINPNGGTYGDTFNQNTLDKKTNMQELISGSGSVGTWTITPVASPIG